MHPKLNECSEETNHESPLMDRVVEKLSLGLVSSGAELATDGGVSDGDGERFLGRVGGVGDHRGSTGEESAVGELGKRRLENLSRARD
jgi:hypothetical protein